MARPAIGAIGLLAIALPLGAQGERIEHTRTLEYEGTLWAAHVAHENLHRATPSEPAVQLIALERDHPVAVDARVLCRAAELALTAGLLSESEPERIRWFQEGEQYAREAHSLEPTDPDPLFYLASARGLIAEESAVRERVRLANEVLEYSGRILELDPDHAGGLHIRGRLGAAAMRTNPMVRFIVQHIMGSQVLAQASWEQAEADFRGAIEGEPDDPSHRIELAVLLLDTGRAAEAEAQLQRAVAADGTDALTEFYRTRARALLADIR